MIHFKLFKLNEEQRRKVTELVTTGKKPSLACMEVLGTETVLLYCRKCMGLPTEHEYIQSTDSFICLKCGEAKEIFSILDKEL
ncbi:MAG: hypothetical protein Q8K86_07305 [Candidatus Nanopelagicaceae bacterium]|nr:hypothetical protein [Candidatus Nanopelagicaceae bacterium]